MCAQMAAVGRITSNSPKYTLQRALIFINEARKKKDGLFTDTLVHYIIARLVHFSLSAIFSGAIWSVIS